MVSPYYWWIDCVDDESVQCMDGTYRERLSFEIVHVLLCIVREGSTFLIRACGGMNGEEDTNPRVTV